MEPRVGNKFRLGRKIGSGSFGEIYLGIPLNFTCLFESNYTERVWCFVGTDIQTNEEVAIKLVSIPFTSESFWSRENLVVLGECESEVFACLSSIFKEWTFSESGDESFVSILIVIVWFFLACGFFFYHVEISDSSKFWMVSKFQAFNVKTTNIQFIAWLKTSYSMWNKAVIWITIET